MTQQAKGLAAAGLVVGVAAAGWFAWNSPRLTAVTPAVASSRWGQPVQVHGTGFTPGLALKLGAPLGKALPLDVLSSTLAVGSLPLDVALEGGEADVPVSLSRGEGEAAVRLVDTRRMPDFTALAAFTGGTLAVLSSPTDVLYLVTPDGNEVAVATARGPSALAMERGKGGERLWVAHRGSPVLRAYAADGSQVAEIPGPLAASALLAGEEGRLYVAEEASHTVAAVNAASGAESWRTPVVARPGALALAGDFVAVGSAATGEVELLNRETGTAEPVLPTGSSAVRALAWDPERDRLLVATPGPLEAPPGSGGITVLDLDAWRVLRHVPSGGGTPGGIALNADATVLALSDLATGEVRTLDVAKLSGDSDEEAQDALLMEVAYPPTRGPCVAWAVDWAPGDGLLRVLDRAGGTVAAYGPMGGGPGRLARVAFNAVARQAPTSPGLALYMIEPTRSGKSCFGCHQEGEAVGRAKLPGAGAAVRVPLLRGRPFQELDEALGRHPGLSRAGAELQSMARWLSSLPPEPNPRLLPKGAPPEKVTLPSGAVGSPRAGMKVADALGCAKCHAPSGQSLAGLWRRWPLFRDGRAGLAPRERDALGAALRVHGEGASLPSSDAERNDLEAWLMVQ